MIYESTRKMSVKEQEVYDLGYLNGKEAALLGPQPDPITGLAPCGCGGKARLLRKPIGNWVDHKIACDSCTTETAWVAGKDSAEMAKIEWNTAMGWKGGAE